MNLLLDPIQRVSAGRSRNISVGLTAFENNILYQSVSEELEPEVAAILPVPDSTQIAIVHEYHFCFAKERTLN